MFDIWGFLLQTLTASGVAVLILVIKALLKDKLPPKWHFASWGVLGLVMLLPTGINGRYILAQWQVLVEMLKHVAGDYSTTRVFFGVPIISEMPKTPLQWVFAIYVLGVVGSIIKYFISYIRLRHIISMGTDANEETIEKVNSVNSSINGRKCKVLMVEGLPSAFVCGVFRPILALPEERETDEKVILHEMLHLKHHDTFFSIIICIMKSLHWCNPFILYCAKVATMDMENRCDQYVLEQLHGEERREYGHILLSMVNERFTGTPATSCINNGGKSIKSRIKTIARFKKYPSGMTLVSSCVLLVLTVSLVIGSKASAVNTLNISQPDVLYAKAKSTPCTTLAGAFDAYANSLIERNDYYRMMCASNTLQQGIYQSMKERGRGNYCVDESGIDFYVANDKTYYIFNMQKMAEDTYEGLLVFDRTSAPEGMIRDYECDYFAMQTLRATKEDGRWIITPLENLYSIESNVPLSTWGTDTLPFIVYSGDNGKISVDVNYQSYFTVDSYTQEQAYPNFIGGNTYTTIYTRVPKPDASFLECSTFKYSSITHLGTKEEKHQIESVAISMYESFADCDDPENLDRPYFDEGSTFFSSSTTGAVTAGGVFNRDSDTIILGGSGSKFTFDDDMESLYPDHFVVDLYIDKECCDRFTLTRKETE